MANEPSSVVVVGASLGGLRTASTLRRLGFEGDLTLVGDEPHLPYDRPPLSKEVLTGAKQAEDVYFHSSEFFEESGIQLCLGSRAVQLDTDVKKITLETGDELSYDTAVIATGARPRTLPGVVDLPGVHLMRTLDDATDICNSFDSAYRLVVIGAGFIGSEVASSAKSRGLAVTIVEAASQPLEAAVGAQVGKRCAALHEIYDVGLRCGVGVAGIEASTSGLRVNLSDGEAVLCDVAVVGIGVTPNIEWLEGSGIEVDRAVLCDQYMRTSVPDVYALGDLASWYNSVFDRRMRVEHWTNTVEQAVVVARNILAGDDPSPYAGIPYFWSDQYGHRLQLAGLATSDDVVFVHDPDGEQSLLALFRDGDRLVGAFAIDQVQAVMKMRALVQRQVMFDEALELAAELQIA